VVTEFARVVECAASISLLLAGCSGLFVVTVWVSRSTVVVVCALAEVTTNTNPRQAKVLM
jgi:hypothetical protein